MKYKLTQLLILGFLLCLASCTEDKKQYVIGVSQCSSGLWREKLNNEMQRELMQRNDVKMELLCAEDNEQKQIDDIQHFIDEKVDIILVSPLSEDHITPIISKAYDAGIPVILFDRLVDNDKYTAFVGGDNVGVGKALATFAIKNLKNGGNVIEIMGDMTSSPARQRHDGFISMISNYPSIHVVASLDCKWKPDVAMVKVDSVLKLHPDVDVIVSHSDYMVSPTKEAIDKKYPDSKIKYIGADGFGSADYGIVAVAAGSIDATAIYPTGGDVVMRTALDVLAGKKVAKMTLIPSHVIDNQNDASFVKSLNEELTKETDNVITLRKKVEFFGHQLELERILLLLVIAILVVFLVMIITVLRLYTVKRRTNEQLHIQQKELTQQRDQLLVMTKELEQATNAKLVFFTNISHDFRTPLTLISAPIESVVQKLQSVAGDNKDVLHLLHMAQRNVQVVLDLVNQILDFRKIENGKMVLKEKPVNLLPALTDWFESFQKLAEKKGLRMELHIDGDDWHVVCDKKRIERMVYNLIGNSMKFTSPGGIIRMLCHHKDGDVKIAIQDTGIGISQDNLQRIFQRFYQIENSNEEGTGIGLALVKSIADLMHGKIDVTSNTDKSKGDTGTTITLTLPLKKADADATEVTVQNNVSIVPVDTVTPKKVEISEDETRQVALIIDDNDDIRTYLSSLLGEKYRVLTAVNGVQGVDIARQTIPDVILCDVMMPVMNGLECCEKLKNDIATSHIPILMLTACSLDEQQVKGLSVGAEAYISKPFSSIVLMAQIESLLKNRAIVRDFYKVNDNDDVIPILNANPNPDLGNSESKNEVEDKDKKKGTEKLSKFDQEFVSKLKFTVEDQLADVDFSVETLAETMCLSRAQLYRKCKALLGDSPVELIRNSRMIRAQVLLSTSDMQITEVGKAVGIPDSSYFAKCYKAYFGVLPSSLSR